MYIVPHYLRHGEIKAFNNMLVLKMHRGIGGSGNYIQPGGKL